MQNTNKRDLALLNVLLASPWERMQREASAQRGRRERKRVDYMSALLADLQACETPLDNA